MIPAIERVLDDGFFQRIEWMIPNPAFSDQARLRRLFEQHDATLVVWCPGMIDKPDCSLSSTAATIRNHAIDFTGRLMDIAAACGATTFCVRSGPDVQPHQRPEAMRGLADSLVQLCERAQQLNNMRVVLEPLDQDAHKCMLLGHSDQAIKLVDMVRQAQSNFSLCWDSGHAMLNQEEPIASLNQCWPMVEQLHLSSPVLDRTHPWFGDTHVCVGEPPGALDMKMLTAILARAFALRQPHDRPTPVAIEQRNWMATSPDNFLSHIRQVMTTAWQQIRHQDC